MSSFYLLFNLRNLFYLIFLSFPVKKHTASQSVACGVLFLECRVKFEVVRAGEKMWGGKEDKRDRRAQRAPITP